VVESDYQVYVGIDWASEAHQACVQDHERRVVAERSFAHTGSAVAEFAQWLRELAPDPGGVAIAIEIPRGAVVETLVEHGFHVYAINPKQLDRFRDRYSVGGAKDDRRDAFVLADSLRTDQPCFRRVGLDDPRVIQLRELTRVDEDLQREGNQLANLPCPARPRGYSARHQTKRQTAPGPDALRLQRPPSPRVLSLCARSSYTRPAEQTILHRAPPTRSYSWPRPARRR